MNPLVINQGVVMTTNKNGEFSEKPLSDIVPPPGTIVMWWSGSNTPPVGWAFCDGQSGRPDMQGRIPLGWGNRSIGTTGGAETVTLGINEMPAHTHQLDQYVGPMDNQCDDDNEKTCPDNYWWNQGANSRTTDHIGGAAHNNMPPFLVIKYIIKL